MRTGGRTLSAGVVAAALLLTACGGSGASDSAPASASGGIPDPCTLLSVSDTLTPILGEDPGEGTVNAEDPDVSKVCLYSSGVILQVETGDRYDEAVALIVAPSTGATTQDLTGVGEEALLADYGDGINQVVARDGGYWIGVTGVISPDQATQIAEAMLAAL